ncbi:hypothetical protein [Erwinia phage phiEaP8]|uniref:Uncharacterized protein n=1 Tax=Erwinia phage phiEaP8 TaxID=2178928 RepID=A0A3G1QTR2_9CAUD|nr:hypothetical protein HYP64_gp43 [Erwinia phage phiEaP8]AWN06249.1 hypothetical protein [Erwinia phage phiEaP8]
MTHIVKLSLSTSDEAVLVQTTDEELPEGYVELGRTATGVHQLAIREQLRQRYNVDADDVAVKYSDKAREYFSQIGQALADDPDLSSQHEADVLNQPDLKEEQEVVEPVKQEPEQVERHDDGQVEQVEDEHKDEA